MSSFAKDIGDLGNPDRLISSRFTELTEPVLREIRRRDKWFQPEKSWVSAMTLASEMSSRHGRVLSEMRTLEAAGYIDVRASKGTLEARFKDEVRMKEIEVSRMLSGDTASTSTK